MRPEKIEEKDCDVYDRKKFLNTAEPLGIEKNR